MKREEIFKIIQTAEDPAEDYGKILANLHYTHFFLMEQYKKLLSAYNLTATQSNVLSIAAFFPNGAALEDIKEMVLEPNSDVSRTVTRLVEKGFAEKMVNRNNRRKVTIKVTTAGRKVLKKFDDEKTLQPITAKLTKNEVRMLVKVLAKLREERG